jgi:hypothetical protein
MIRRLETAGVNFFDGQHICRGIPASIAFKKKDLPVLEKISEGKAKAQELWNLLDKDLKASVGVYWWLMGKKNDGILNYENPEEFAYAEDTIDSNWGKSMIENVKSGEDDSNSFSIAIILVAKKPGLYEDNDWDGSIDTDKIKKVELVALRYKSPKAWVEFPFSKVVKL